MLDGQDGNDACSVAAGNDLMRGRAGNDATGAKSGTDTAWFAASPAAVSVNLTAGTAAGEGADSVLHHGERDRLAVQRRPHR